ncbi:hypothetical protein E6C60_3477 [Paenibacillus algicola]|uniref:Uncharacterized protein n=1 Tax=Paenibacillus algicola TaxID=2565926 RepID=A0A4P8XNL9_9BACL|nr:hypothetical protein E6C60_3477 [Paenibacillus algicola]
MQAVPLGAAFHAAFFALKTGRTLQYTYIVHFPGNVCFHFLAK